MNDKWDFWIDRGTFTDMIGSFPTVGIAYHQSSIR